MKRFHRWLSIIIASVAILTPVVISISRVHNVNAAMAGEVDTDAVRTNALYKVFYANLLTCHSNMQSPITESSENTFADFNSATYFNESARRDDFLKFPYDVGGKNQSSCPKMIMGWKTGWPASWFTSTGNFSGLLSINRNAAVPKSGQNNSVTEMGTFLKNIGYTQKSDADTTLDGRKCFYLKARLTPEIKADYMLVDPSKGDYFETVDYCVKTNGSSVVASGDSIIYLKGKNEYFGSDYDGGHLTDASNIAFTFFSGTDSGLAPQFRTVNDSSVSFGGKTYLQANLNQIDLRYPFYVADMNENQTQAASIPVEYLHKKSQIDNGICDKLGYTWCAWYDGGVFSRTIYIGSLMPAGGSITYSGLKDAMVKLFRNTQFEDGRYLFDSVSAVDYNPSSSSFSKGDKDKFVKYFIGDTSAYNDGKFNDAEKYMLYYTYLKDYYQVSTRADAVDGGVQVNWLGDDGKFTKLYVYSPSAHAGEKRYTLDGDNKWSGTAVADWRVIAELLAAIDVSAAFSSAEVSDPILDPNLPSTEPAGDSGTTPTCFNSASSLGWILCPVMKGVGTVIQGLYDKVIASQFLEVEAQFLDGSSATYSGWKGFRDFANIIFAIIFLIVILSQVTGIGLDNYSIKKILPRLIVVAILVNISFIICQLAVDISNVLGYSLNDTFDRIGNGIVLYDPNGNPYSATIGNFMSGLLSTLFTGGLTVGIIAAVAVTWELWLFPLLLFLLGSLISILFFAILLGVRKAGIIILIVLSPIAIVCYALPNTKSFFDKWLKLFTNLLMVFPICGLLMGGGLFASKLLLAVGGNGDSGFFFQLVAMLLQVVPFFFVPAIVKSSMIAMGNLGMKLSQFGKRFGSLSTGALRGSDGYRDIQDRMRGHNAQKYLNREQWQNRHRILGAPGRALSRVGARVRSSSEVAQNSYNRKRSRMADAALKQRLANQQAGFLANSDLNQKFANAEDAALQRHINEMASDITLANADISTNNAELSRRHAAALDALENEQSDENRAAVQAFQDMLVKSDPGRTHLYDNIASRVARGGTRGVELAAQHLLREHVGDIKPNNRDFFSMLGDISRISQGQNVYRNSFAPMLDDHGRETEHYNSTYYGSQGIGSYDAASLAKADEGSIERIIEQAHNGNLTDEQKSQLEIYTRDALTNKNIHVQGKIGDKLRKLRDEIGAPRISLDDSGPIPIRHNNNGDNNIPPGWTQGPGGIILPPGSS